MKTVQPLFTLAFTRDDPPLGDSAPNSLFRIRPYGMQTTEGTKLGMDRSRAGPDVGAGFRVVMYSRFTICAMARWIGMLSLASTYVPLSTH